MHGALELAGDCQGHHFECALHCGVDLLAILATWPVQHVVDYLIAIAGVAYADTEAQEVLGTEVADQIA